MFASTIAGTSRQCKTSGRMKNSNASHALSVARICQHLWIESKSAQHTPLRSSRRLKLTAPDADAAHGQVSSWPGCQKKGTSAATGQRSHDAVTMPFLMVPSSAPTRQRYWQQRHISHSSSAQRHGVEPKGKQDAQGAVLLAALKQSEASTAQCLTDITLHLLRDKNNAALAWECYTDLTSRDMLHYLSQDQFRDLIRTFNHYASHKQALEYVLTLVEDMKGLGYRVSRKEKLIVMRLLGMNGKLTEMQHIFDDLTAEQLLLSDSDAQKPYNVLLSAYQQQKDLVGTKRVAEKSLEIYGEMIERGLRPSAATTRILMENLRAGGNSQDMVEKTWSWFWNKLGLKVGGKARDLEPSLYKEMLMLFASAGRPEYALEVNDVMVKKGLKRDVRMMTALIHKVGRAGDIDKAMELLNEMVGENITPNITTLNALIDIYAHKKPHPDIDGASRIYDMLRDVGLKPNVITIGTLVDMFAKEGDTEMVYRLYRDMITNHSIRPNPHILSSIIECFFTNNDRQSALEVLRILRNYNPYGVLPNEVTYNLVMRCCVKRNEIKNAFALLDLMLEANVTPDARTFTPLLGLLADHGDAQGATQLCQRMIDLGVKPNAFTYTALLEAHAKAGEIAAAENIFEKLKQRWRPNAITYNALLYMYVKNNDMDKVLDLYKSMLNTIKMNEYTYGILMYFFSRRKEPSAVESILETMQSNDVKPSVTCWTILMQAYLESDHYQEALQVLDRMKQAKASPSFVTMSILAKGAVRMGDIRLAEDILANAIAQTKEKLANRNQHVADEYRQFEPLADVTHVLSTDTYTKDLPVTVEDLLERRRSLQPPVELPPPHMFDTLINAYISVGRFEEAKQVFRKMMDLAVPVELHVFVSLMRIYREEQRFDMVEALWNLLYASDKYEIDGQLDPDIGTIPIPTSDTYNLSLLAFKPDTSPAVTAEGMVKPQTPRKIESPVALSMYMDTLMTQGRYQDAKSLWAALTKEGYPVDVHNWNLYVSLLIRMGDVREACQTVVDHLSDGQSKFSRRSRDAFDVDESTQLSMRTCRLFSEVFGIQVDYSADTRLRALVMDRIRDELSQPASQAGQHGRL